MYLSSILSVDFCARNKFPVALVLVFFSIAIVFELIKNLECFIKGRRNYFPDRLKFCFLPNYCFSPNSILLGLMPDNLNIIISLLSAFLLAPFFISLPPFFLFGKFSFFPRQKSKSTFFPLLVSKMILSFQIDVAFVIPPC